METYLDGMKAIMPELVLTALALGVLVLDLLMKGKNSRIVGYFTVTGLAVIGMMLVTRIDDAPQTVFGMVTVDSFGTFFKLFTVAALIVVSVFVMSDRKERQHGIGEYYFLLLGAAVGIFFMVSTYHLLLLVLGIELLSLSSYALAGFHKGDRKSGEAAMKYVVFGGLSAQLSSNVLPVGIAVVLILAGFAYKVSIVPFHFWAPDVYEGSPTPVTTFLAVASKAAGVGALLRFLGGLFIGTDLTQVQEVVAQYGDQVGKLVAIVAAVTMTLGNFAAMRQSSLKRMLAYSSIAHAGYVLIGVAAMSQVGFSAAMYYLAAYYFMNLGAFGVLLYFESSAGSDKIDALRGFGYKAPLISIAMVAFLVSLTGLPPTVGFYGKYLLFQVGIEAELMWLVVVAALNSVISLFYYFRVAKALFLKDETEKSVIAQPLFAGMLGVLGVLTILFGLMPGTIQDLVSRCGL